MKELLKYHYYKCKFKRYLKKTGVTRFHATLNPNYTGRYPYEELYKSMVRIDEGDFEECRNPTDEELEQLKVLYPEDSEQWLKERFFLQGTKILDPNYVEPEFDDSFELVPPSKEFTEKLRMLPPPKPDGEVDPKVAELFKKL